MTAYIIYNAVDDCYFGKKGWHKNISKANIYTKLQNARMVRSKTCKLNNLTNIKILELSCEITKEH